MEIFLSLSWGNIARRVDEALSLLFFFFLMKYIGDRELDVPCDRLDFFQYDDLFRF